MPDHPVLHVEADDDGHRVVTVALGVVATARVTVPNHVYFAGDTTELAAAVGARMLARAATLRGDRP